MKLKPSIAMIAGLIALAGCSEKDSITSTEQSNVPAVTKEPSSASTPATPAPATPTPPPANTGAANTLTNTNAPEAK